MVFGSSFKGSLSLPAATLLLLGQQALAQEQGTGDNTAVADIVVTAQKYSQSINDVPMSVFAVTGETLEQRGITSTYDLQKIMPGFTATETNYSTPIYTLRGIGLYDTGLASSPAVSTYVDEVPLPFPVMTLGATLDLARVEVLKGPQGILFGQNSTGGAINYIAAKPTDTLRMGGDVSYERFGKVDADGFISGPISQRVRARFAVKAIEGGAWQVSATRDDHLGDKRQLMGRLLLDVDVSDRLSLKFNFNGDRDRSDTQAGQLQKIAPGNPAAVDPKLFSQPIVSGDDLSADWTPFIPNHVDDSFYQLAMRGEYQASDAALITSTTSYQHQDVDHNVDNDATALPISQTNLHGYISSFNQELRVRVETPKFNWILGGNYENDKVSDTVHTYFFSSDECSTCQVFPNIPPLHGTSAVVGQTVDTYAAFGNLEYALEDHLKAHAGVRYTNSRRSGNNCGTGRYDGSDNLIGQVFMQLQTIFQSIGLKTTPFVPIAYTDCFVLTPAPDLSPLLHGIPLSLSEDNVSWRGGVDYKTDNGTLLYVNASRGWKSGVISDISAALSSATRPAKQERLDAYEVGIKAPMFERRVHLNAAGFYYDYTNKQVKSRLADPIFGLLEVIVNVPKSRVWGIEADIQVQPVTGLTLSAAGTYLNSKVTSVFNTVNQEGVSGDFRGSQLPYTPKFTMTGDISYEWPIRGKLNAFVGTSITSRSSDNTSFRTARYPAPDYKLPGYALVDLRAGFGADDDRWRVTFYGRNITNKYYWTFVYNIVDTISRDAGRPAFYGAMISVRL